MQFEKEIINRNKYERKLTIFEDFYYIYKDSL